MVRRLSSVATFVAGFLFDYFTMQRIDAWLDLAFQLAYLGGLTGLLVYQHREVTGRWTPAGLTARWWRYSVETLHFLYGGLLSAYVVLYFRSSTSSRAAVFLVLLVGVMVVNEVPHVRGAGYRLRVGLFAFCVLSFLTYFIPLIVGRIDAWVFLLSLLLSGAVVWQVRAGRATVYLLDTEVEANEEWDRDLSGRRCSEDADVALRQVRDPVPREDLLGDRHRPVRGSA